MTNTDIDAAGGDGVEVWLLDIAGRDVAPLLPLLDAGERARAERYVSEPARRLFIASRAAQRVLAARYLDTDPRAVRLVRRCPTCGSTDHGRPALPAAPDLDFSVSHTRDLVVLAFRRGGRVGVDVELADRRVDLDGTGGLVGASLVAAEAATLPAGPPDARRAAFYRLWTRKEAALKLTGHGLTVPLTDLDVTGELAVVSPVPAGWPARPIRLTDLGVTGGYTAALATTGAAPVSVRLREAEVDAAV
jgi:4'-phosphopantetheinyl transferase